MPSSDARVRPPTRPSASSGSAAMRANTASSNGTLSRSSSRSGSWSARSSVVPRASGTMASDCRLGKSAGSKRSGRSMKSDSRCGIAPPFQVWLPWPGTSARWRSDGGNRSARKAPMRAGSTLPGPMESATSAGICAISAGTSAIRANGGAHRCRDRIRARVAASGGASWNTEGVLPGNCAAWLLCRQTQRSSWAGIGSVYAMADMQDS